MTKEEFQKKCNELMYAFADKIGHPLIGCQLRIQSDYEAMVIVHDPMQVIEVFTVWYNPKLDDVFWCRGQLPPKREVQIN